ncbi:MAG: hypothetical protein VB056_15490 [Sphaerochaeta associata]|uniref:hypothetical protein n=1 Tax=Sphaerochaeta associata TaxID=1129264 RepID=UPI002B1F3C1C|nr:hypothetical protein [Sphaerochaeta associata]MEA5030278.1 hypothetical protein [Sphaerochaeta associata]
MEIWDKQPGESQKAYAWFCRYRDYGVDRSIAKVLQKYIGKASSAVLSRWSVKYDWVKRAETYDEHLEKERRKEYEAHNLEMGKRHIQQLCRARVLLIAGMTSSDCDDAGIGPRYSAC